MPENRGGRFVHRQTQRSSQHLDKTGRQAVDYSWFDLVGNVGVLLMVVAYLLLQLEKLSSSAVSYLLLNAVGAVLVIISLMFRFNLSAFFMEAFWLLISLYGLTKPLFSKPKAV
jgi:membrane-associated HD superfamily phosphohydrolase